MGIVEDVTAEKISLHGLGFLQVKLENNLRLHVWHPELPRRHCFEYSAVHDHRFGFESTILRGTQINHTYRVDEVATANYLATHDAYKHEGARLPTGNRPWDHAGQRHVTEVDVKGYEAGETYRMAPYQFHSTEPGGDGIVVTLMRKTSIGETGATSLCEIGHAPDVDFDRKQMKEVDMWFIVAMALGANVS